MISDQGRCTATTSGQSVQDRQDPNIAPQLNLPAWIDNTPETFLARFLVEDECGEEGVSEDVAYSQAGQEDTLLDAFDNREDTEYEKRLWMELGQAPADPTHDLLEDAAPQFTQNDVC